MTIKTWLLLLSCVLFFQSQAKADSVITTVFNVFENTEKTKLLVLSAVDGRVYKVALPTKSKEAKVVRERITSFLGQVVKLSFQVNGTEALLTDLRYPAPGEVDARTMDLNHFQYNQLRQFAPTELKNYEAAEKLFREMLNDGDKNRSQCFKRAHMWVFDMWSKGNVSSQKIYMFYTHRYRNLEKFDWWFHVAPLVTAGGVEYVMDGTFMKKPTPVKEWYSWFLHTNKITCPEITSFNQYNDNQWNRLCYIMKTSMYMFSPVDIQARDNQGVEKNHWELEELQDARRAFKNFEKSYEGLDNGKQTITH